MKSLKAISFAGLLVVLFCATMQAAVGFAMLSSSTRQVLRSRTAATRPLFAVLNNSTSTRAIPSNQELVTRRMQVAREKKEARRRTLQQDHDRNLQLKRLLHTTSNYTVPPLYAVKVSVCDELRESLRLNGRERRGRVFIPLDSNATRSIKALKQELHSFFRCLLKSTYVLHATLPEVASDGSILSPSFEDDGSDTDTVSWSIETDEDVVKTFEMADDLFASNNVLKRPSILIHVSKDPNAPPPPPTPHYLENLADPSCSDTMTMLSFYAFPPSRIADPDEFALKLRKVWKPFQPLGRVYVAQEGVNAQMSVPTNVLENFMECCKSIPELGVHMENGINVDPKPLSMDEFAVAGVPVNGKPAPPFRNLHVRVRGQVVADGLNKPLDWQEAGYDMPPLEWHEKLKEAREKRHAGEPDDAPIILDCRNDYETDVGRFEGAEPLNTENFRESWDVLKDRLADTPKDSPIMTYCTGGIRCVKVGAYLTQELGFTNVSRLAGGIIAYDRTLSEEQNDEEPMFKGTNFVFDGRLGRQITEDSLGTCITCGAETSLVSNCRNDNCHKRMVQCQECRTSFHGTCSDACRNRVMNGAMMPRRRRVQTAPASETTANFTNLEDYSAGHSTPPPSLYREMELNTKHFLPSGSHMVSGASQGRWLTQLASMSREGRILELGTFTGYATACFLEGAANAGEAIGVSGGNRQAGPYVMSLERDSRAIDVAVAHLNVMCQHGVGEEAAEVACVLRANGNELPNIEDETVSMSYKGVAGCEVVHVTDALATMEEMAQGKGELQPAAFDIVFVDADKTRLLEYVEACLSSDRVLKKGGLIVVDNVLWKGLVLEASTGDFSRVDDSDETEDEARKSRRARKLATKMHSFNSGIVKDDRVEVVVLPMRDGLSVIRKR